MAEDWDLFAVVRSCQSATSTATTETPPATSISAVSPQDSATSCLVPFTVKEENDPFSVDPNLVQPTTNGFQGLHQLFVPFNPTTTTTTTTTSGRGINPNSPLYDFAGSTGQQRHHHHHPVVPPTTSTYTSIWPHSVPEAPTSGFSRFHEQQQQQHQLQVVQKKEFQLPQSSSAIVLPRTQSQTPRSRKRKSQQKRMVCHVTADNLSADLWAWRKYGQKPIKGSPYPRNYYRCSSSKGCAARKQVERSTTEPDMFIVTYTGDHTHPRPTHRNSLAGSTRNKPSTAYPPTTHGSGSPSSPVTLASFSTPVLSPTTPLTAPPETDEAAEDPTNAGGTERADPEMEPDLASDDDDILIPNTAAMSEDIFLCLDNFGCGSDAPNNPPGLSPDSFDPTTNHVRSVSG